MMSYMVALARTSSGNSGNDLIYGGGGNDFLYGDCHLIYQYGLLPYRRSA